MNARVLLLISLLLAVSSLNGIPWCPALTEGSKFSWEFSWFGGDGEITVTVVRLQNAGGGYNVTLLIEGQPAVLGLPEGNVSLLVSSNDTSFLDVDVGFNCSAPHGLFLNLERADENISIAWFKGTPRHVVTYSSSASLGYCNISLVAEYDLETGVLMRMNVARFSPNGTQRLSILLSETNRIFPWFVPTAVASAIIIAIAAYEVTLRRRSQMSVLEALEQ